VRPTDVLCFRGHYGRDLFAAAGGTIGDAQIDLRHVARSLERGEVGTLDAYATAHGWDGARDPLSARGRAGKRVSQLLAIAGAFCEIARDPARVR
jgi:hypothetical protein